MKFKTTKISSEGLGGDSAKFCISEKFPVVCYLPGSGMFIRVN